MLRPHRLHAPTLAALLLAVPGFALAATPTRAAWDGARPNVIVVLADDLGYGDVGANGARQIRTPSIDRLAREGVRLTQFFASGNVCTPSRAGLLTGRYPVRSGLARHVIYAHSGFGIAEAERLLPELLRDVGYQTWLVGKWHLGHVPSAWPTRHGFDQFFGLPASNDMKNAALYRGEERIEFPLDQAAAHGRLAAEAVRLIESADARPFFLLFAPVAPHRPIVPSPRFAGRSAAGRYGDVVEELDAGIGQILAAVERRGLARDTLVIVTSDNGPTFEGSPGPARGRKASPEEGGYLVPFVARWPGRIPRGAVSDAIAMNIDLLPTLARVAGATPPSDRPIDGADLSAVLRGGRRSPHEALYFFQHDLIAAVRTQRWRYVARTIYQTYDVDMIAEFGGALLFDIERQGAEFYDVGASEPEVVARMDGLLRRGRAELEGLPQHDSPWPPPE
jgi:uncharacterized sulfatase